jgi:hypothetical protein
MKPYLTFSRHLALGALAAALVPALVIPLAVQAAGGHAVQASATKVTIRVEGISSTLLSSTQVSTTSSPIDKDGKPADTCTGDTAAVALQDATHGDWTAGTYSAGLGYPVLGIRGESHPFTSAYYWSLWIDGKPATTGICGATLHQGDSILLFPQCSQASAAKCPQGSFNPAVLDLRGPTVAKVGKQLTVTVKSLSNLTGKASAGAGVKLVAAGHTVKTNSSGTAHLTFRSAGTHRIVATAPDSIRDELTVKVVT